MVVVERFGLVGQHAGVHVGDLACCEQVEGLGEPPGQCPRDREPGVRGRAGQPQRGGDLLAGPVVGGGLVVDRGQHPLLARSQCRVAALVELQHGQPGVGAHPSGVDRVQRGVHRRARRQRSRGSDRRVTGGQLRDCIEHAFDYTPRTPATRLSTAPFSQKVDGNP